MQTASTFIYCGVNVTTAFRVMTSCYMNLRFSRPLEECKKQFVFAFCSDDLLDQMPQMNASTRE